MDVSVFAERLRRAREELGFTQSELAAEAGVKRSTLDNWEQGRNYPEVAQLVSLCKSLGVDPEDILGLDADLDRWAPLSKARTIKAHLEKDLLYCEPRRRRAVAEALSRVERRIATLDRRAKDSRDSVSAGGRSVQVPFLGTIRAGTPTYAEEFRDGGVAVPAGISADFALRVKGDSMIGLNIVEGDIALCRQPGTELPTGRIVVALVDNTDATLKLLLKEDNHWILRAGHPKYRDIIVNPENDIIQGVAVMILRNLDHEIDPERLPLFELMSLETGIPSSALRAFIAAFGAIGKKSHHDPTSNPCGRA
jgi:repressor LexA